MTEKEKMLAGEMYNALDPELVEGRNNARRFTSAYNSTSVDEQDKRKSLLKGILGACGENIMIEPPFIPDYGSNMYVGENFGANFGLIVLDTCEVRIGKNCMIGPRVSLITATHPVNAEDRISGLEYGKPITMGDNVWLGSNVVINPGVTIGNNVVVASGAVVTKDVPDNVVVAGVPAKIIKSAD